MCISMYRKDLIEPLLDRAWSLRELAEQLDMTQQDVEDDVHHLLRSLKHAGYRVLVEPASCRHCGFVFHKDKLRKPGKCPRCRHTWILEPRLRLERTGKDERGAV